MSWHMQAIYLRKGLRCASHRFAKGTDVQSNIRLTSCFCMDRWTHPVIAERESSVAKDKYQIEALSTEYESYQPTEQCIHFKSRYMPFRFWDNKTTQFHHCIPEITGLSFFGKHFTRALMQVRSADWFSCYLIIREPFRVRIRTFMWTMKSHFLPMVSHIIG